MLGVFLAAFLVVSFVGPARAVSKTELKVLSDRTESNVKPLFQEFERQSGVKIQAVYLEQGLLERLASRPAEADVVITKDADLLEGAKNKGLLGRIPEKSLQGVRGAIPAAFIDRAGLYFVDAYRARTIIYSKERVKPGEIANYEDLAQAKWKKRLCIRSGFHDYNLSLFSQWFSAFGEAKARSMMRGYHENLARAPKGNDREQARAIAEGKCDVALLNSYYFPLMNENPDQKAWAAAVAVVFPDQGREGAFVMQSALALTKSTARAEEAGRLLEFFAGEKAQRIIANLTYQYPTNEKVAPHVVLKTLGAGQPGVVDGKFKHHFVELAEFAKHRDQVVKALNELNFDQP